MLVFAGRTVPISELALQTFLQVGLPLLVSRVLVRVPALETVRPVGVNLSFFVLVTMIVGANRASLFSDPGLVLSLSGAAVLRTFGIGLLVTGLGLAIHRRREERIAWTLFGSFKNLGLTALLAVNLFGLRAAIPAIVCLVFEILWLTCLPLILRGRG